MMRPPPFLLGAALLFWGWRTDMVGVGLIAGGLLELSHGVKGRWEFTDREFNRLWDVCTILFLAAAAYLRFSEDITSGAYKFFQWMPMIFFPMALGTTYSVRDGVPLKAFSWLMRRKGATGGDRPVAFGWVYFTVCIVMAGATNARGDIGFYVGFVVLTGWALWSVRPRRMNEAAWAVAFVLLALMAFYGQLRLPDLQAYMEMKVSEMFVKFGRREFDPQQSRTAMGRIGSLKQSPRIVLKLKPEIGPVPERLRQASYFRLDGTVWRGGRGGFESVSVEQDITSWNLKTNAEPHSTVRIIERVDRKSALLSLPLGTVQLRELAVGSVQTNAFGVVKTEENPGLLNYTAHYGKSVIDAGPIEADFAVPPEEQEAIEQIARELQLGEQMPEREKIERIVAFFQEKFRYTTFQQARDLGLHARTPLTDFLTKTRAGHCEYFGSASVFLLRHYKIPARYATGYAVQEYSEAEQAYVIRDLHGHAWAQAYVDGKWDPEANAYVGGRWVEVDSTPAGWEEAEREEFPAHQDWKEWWERFTFGFLEWRWLGDWGVVRMVAPWIAAPMIGFLAWRIFGRKLRRGPAGPRQTQAWPGADSEFFELEERLAKAGLAQGNDETTGDWLKRISSDLPVATELLETIARIHQKYRFNPDGLTMAEREQLRTLVRHCVARL
jgi:protein-glutamine gamma-glutamyltransferase